MEAVPMHPPCLTRVMTDDDAGVEIAQISRIVARIQLALGAVPGAEREYIAQALLDYAMKQTGRGRQTVASTRAARGVFWNAPWRP